MTHYIAMGGEHGCMPDNCQAYESLEPAIDGLDNIYELSPEQLQKLRDNGTTKLTREQGGAYCEVSECDCDEPWEHAEFDDEDNWPDYAKGPEDGDYIITSCGPLGGQTVIYKYNSPPWRHIVKDGDDIKKIISDEMEREQFWPNIWSLSDHGNLSITTLEEVQS